MEEEVGDAVGFPVEQLVLRRNIYKLLRRPHRRALETDHYLVMHISGLLFKLCSHGRPLKKDLGRI